MDYTPILSHIAFRLNEQARTAFVDLLPAERSAKVGPVEEGGDDVDVGWQAHLLAAMDIPDVEDEIGDEAEEGAVGESENAPSDSRSEDEGEAAGEGFAEEPAPPSQGIEALFALLFSVGAARISARLLQHMPLHMQGGVLHRLLTFSPLSCTRGLSVDERNMVEWVREKCSGHEHWGVEHTCEVLRALESPRAVRRLLRAVDETDHESALVLQHHLYVFEDLLQLSERDLQILLANESNETLAQAFLDIEEAQRRHFLRHVSSRRRALIGEEQERYALATPIEIEGAQHGLLATARFLYNTRRITTYFGSLDETEEEPERDLEREEGREEEENHEVEAAAAPPKNKRALKQILLALAVLVSLAFWFIWLFSGEGGGREDLARGHGWKTKGAATGKATISWLSGGMENERARDSQAQVLEEGQREVTGTGVQAVVEVPGLAQIELDEAAEIEHVSPDEADSAQHKTLDLRMGRMRATIVDEAFRLRTPLVSIRGPRGARFMVRSVLDATTHVQVQHLWIEVQSRVNPQHHWRLLRGDSGRFTSDGGGDIQRE